MSDAWSLLFVVSLSTCAFLEVHIFCVILDYVLCRTEYNFLPLDN